MPVPPPLLASSPGVCWPPPFAVSFEFLMLTSSLAYMPVPPPKPPVAVTVAFTRSSFPLAYMPMDPPLVPEPPVVDREEPSLPWIVSLPLPDDDIPFSPLAPLLPPVSSFLPSSSSVTSPVPETVTAFLFVFPASTFRLLKMTVRRLVELLMIFTTFLAAS